MFGNRSSTVELSTQAFVLENARPYRHWLRVAFVLLVLAGLGYLGLNYVDRMFSPAARVSELEAENARIASALQGTKAQLDEIQLKREMEKATQRELEDQIKQLNGEVSRLKEELNFFKKTKNKPS